MSKNKGYLFLLVIICAMAPLVGCKDKMGGTSPLSIKVTMDGAPLEGATVSLFQLTGDGNSAVGITDATGVAVIKSTLGWEGTFPGEYSVTIKKTEYSTSSTAEAKSEADRTSADDGDSTFAVSKELLPKKYASPASSGLKVVHEKGKPLAEIEITANP